MINLKNVTFTYGEETENGGVYDINLSIERGKFIVITGGSGCGKTTLTRLINGLVPHYYDGSLSGLIELDGRDISKDSISQISRKVSSVFQNPRSQFFSVDSTGELAFQLENQGKNPEEIVERMNHVIDEFNVEKLMGRSLFELSGGEKQKLACAGVALSGADIIVLDEPSSNLDMQAIEELRVILKKWKEQGKTIVISEHRLYYLKELMDEMIYMEDGRMVKTYSREQISSLTAKEMNSQGLRTLSLEALAIDRFQWTASNNKIKINPFSFYYDRSEYGINIKETMFPKSSIIAIIGHNGAGKSTFAKCMCGLEKKCKVSINDDNEEYKGKKLINHSFMVMQDVNYQLFTESVTDEVVISLCDYKKMDEEEREREAKKVLSHVDMEEYGEKHPMALSGGQKQRVAVACAMASNREVMFFDEPTSGLDYKHMMQTATLIKNLANQGNTIFVITHDLELVFKCCTHIFRLEHGEVQELYELNEENAEKTKDDFMRMKNTVIEQF